MHNFSMSKAVRHSNLLDTVIGAFVLITCLAIVYAWVFASLVLALVDIKQGFTSCSSL